MEPKPWARLLDKLSPFKPVGVALAFSPWLIVLYMIVSSFVGELIKEDQTILQNFIEWFGTAYSLFLALVLVNVWEKFDALDREIDREVDAIATLSQTTNYVEEAITPENAPLDTERVRWIKCIKDNIKEYVEHVIHNYRAEDHFAQQRRNGDKILANIGHFISSLAHSDIKESFIRELFIDLNEAKDARSDRITQSQQRTPATVWWVAIIASAVWLLPFLGLQIKDDVAKSILIIAVTFVITIVLVIIKDLDEPYEGTWKLDLEEWDIFHDLLDPSPHILFLFSNRNKFLDLMSRNWIGRLFSVNECKLSSLIRADILQTKWKEFLRQIPVARPRANKTPRYDILYSDTFAASGYEIAIPGNPKPSVVLRQGDRFDIVVSKQEIEDCANFAEFKGLFDRNIRQLIPWF